MDVNAAGIIVQNKKGEVLVLHRKDFVPEGNRWGLPGGKVAEGKEPIETAREKTLQEVALDFKKEGLTHFGEFHFIDGVGKSVVYNAFIVKVEEDPEMKLNLDGHDEYKWEIPENLLAQEDLMLGMYPILRKFSQK